MHYLREISAGKRHTPPTEDDTRGSARTKEGAATIGARGANPVRAIARAPDLPLFQRHPPKPSKEGNPVTFQANCPSQRGYKTRQAFVFKTTKAGSIRATRHDKDCIRITTTALGGADTVTKRLQRRGAQSGQLPNWRASPVPRRGPTGQMNAKPAAVPQRVTLSFPS